MSYRTNPFNPGSGTDPPFLAGRGPVIGMFERTLGSITGGKSSNMVVTGLRGTGKTVLLNRFATMCQDAGFMPIKRSQFNPKYNKPKNFYDAIKYDVCSALASISVRKKITQKI